MIQLIVMVHALAHSLHKDCKNERRNLMNANHRDICKFNDPFDPNYIKLRDSLGSAIDDLLRSGMSFNIIMTSISISH